MHEAHTASTLELVVNEQQLQNMSQIDLSRPTDNSNNSNQNNNSHSNNHQQQSQAAADFFSFRGIKEWPAKIRDGFNAKLDEAKSKSETRTEYAFEVIKAFSGIILWALCLICTIIVPVLLFFIGLFNLDNCMDRPQLPYLVFGIGFVMTSSNLFNLALALDLPILTNHRLLSVDTKNTIASILNILFNCMVALLYILTTYMIYTVGGYSSLRHSSTATTNEDTSKVDKHNTTMEEEISPEDEQPIVAEYQATLNCGALLYQFTFWFITLTLCLFALLSLIAISLFAYNRYRLAILRGSTPRSQPMNHVATNMNPTVNNGTTGSPFNSTGNSRMI